VAHTPEQRDKHPLCGARKRSDGTPCRKFAGEGTDHFGTGCCRLHGGNTPNQRKHAVKVEAQRRAAQFGEPIPVQPGEALLHMLWMSYGSVVWLQQQIEQHADMRSFEARVDIQSHKEERDRVARIAKAALDAGVAERQIKLAERYAHMLANVIRAILSDPELALTREQQAMTPAVVRRHLVQLDGDGAEPRAALPAAS
jgi:hypothetical protein